MVSSTRFCGDMKFEVHIMHKNRSTKVTCVRMYVSGYSMNYNTYIQLSTALIGYRKCKLLLWNINFLIHMNSLRGHMYTCNIITFIDGSFSSCTY